MTLLRVLSPCLAALASAAYAGGEGVGTTSGNFLKIPAHSRAAAMGEAFSAVSDDESALSYNPAGIAGSFESEASATHIEWFQGIRLEHLGGFYAAGAPGTFGAALTWLQVDPMARTLRVANSPDPLSNYAQIGSFSPHDAALSFSYARPFLSSLETGATLTFLQQNIDDQNGYAADLDLGMRWLDLPGKLDLGLVLKHAGVPLSLGGAAYPLPLELRAGLARRFGTTYPLLLSFDLGMALDGDLMPAFGAEAWIHPMLALRAGWRGGYAMQPSAGLGFKVAAFKLDYAWVPFSVLGATHRVTASWGFGGPEPGLGVDPGLIGPLGDPSRRMAHWDLKVPSPRRLRSWRLEIRDPSGPVVWVLSGQGAAPTAVHWDGRGSDGRPLADGIYEGVLEAVYGGGDTRKSKQRRVELDSTPPKLGLRLEPGMARADGTVSPVKIEPTAVDAHGIGGWSLEILDRQGRRVRLYSGSEGIPVGLAWDGRDLNGIPATPGANYALVLSAWDKLGNRSVSAPMPLRMPAKAVHFTMAADALFDSGKAVIMPSAYQDLVAMRDKILAYVPKGSVVEVVGHTDNIPVAGGSYPDNQALSVARAEAVVKFLWNVLGMDPKTFHVVGKADREPVADNATPEGRRKNRRVEIVIEGRTNP